MALVASISDKVPPTLLVNALPNESLLKDLVEILSDGEGFKVINLADISTGALDRLWGYVLDGFSEQFSIENPSPSDMINSHLVNGYNNIFPNLSVLHRTLKSSVVDRILKEDWLRMLCAHLEMFPVDTYGLGYPSFTWRLTRPQSDSDYRPLHKDSWFRMALGHPEIIDPRQPKNLQIIRVWISLFSVPFKSGLLISPNSQKSEKPGFSIIEADGTLKPLVNEEDLSDFKLIHANTNPGSCVVFSEKLLHGGAPTLTENCRVSMEFSLATQSQSLYKIFHF